MLFFVSRYSFYQYIILINKCDPYIKYSIPSLLRPLSVLVGNALYKRVVSILKWSNWHEWYHYPVGVKMFYSRKTFYIYDYLNNIRLSKLLSYKATLVVFQAHNSYNSAAWLLLSNICTKFLLFPQYLFQPLNLQ